MNRVPLLLTQNPGLKVLNLEFSEIESLEALMPYLQEFLELEDLNLFGNRLVSLPQDLSKLQKLKKIDINNNLFTGFDDVLKSLQTLPSLIDLQYTLMNPEDEDLVMAALPALRQLNDKEIVQDNRHEITPVALSMDIEFSNEDLALKQEELEKIAIIYDDLRSFWREIEPRSDKKLAEYFDSNIKSIMMDLSEINKQDLASHLHHCYTLKAKYSFYNICQDKAIQYIGRNSKKLASIFQDIHNSYSFLFDEAISMVFSLDKKYTSIIENLRSQLEKSNQQTSEVLEAAEKLEKECEKHITDKTKLRELAQQDHSDLLERLKDLSEENQRYLDIIVKNSKASAETAMTFKKYSVPQQVRNLNLRQMKEIIKEIYDSKTKFDKKCFQDAQPRETMEQHMYTYLNHKYGLKTLIIEWAAGIISGIKRLSDQDNDILVFGKILKNEMDEEFRFIQQELKSTILELVRAIISRKKQMPNSVPIEDKLQNKLNGFLKRQECREILGFLYNESDFLVIFPTIESSLNPRGKIKFTIFEQLVLGFQQHSREKSLQEFISKFKLVDSDSDGSITQPQFKELCTFLNLKEVAKPLTSITKFTLSDCVSYLIKPLLSRPPSLT